MISLIVAMDKNGVIGKGGGIPWHLSSDFAYFKKVTKGHPIIMGRKTFESISKALPERTNIVVTSNINWTAQDCERALNIEDALMIAEIKPGGEDVFIIGGGAIFKEVIESADKLYVTEIDTEVRDGDTFFPEIDKKKWKETSRESHKKDAKNDHDYNFVVYDRRR